jgi:hypothetical protein
MLSLNPETYDDRLLTRYLLGALPPEETERMDELSIVDDEFAQRLHAVENELVDAYVRNELPEIDVQKFKSFYLSSAKRRQKVQFAEAFEGFKKPLRRSEEAAETAPVAPAEARPLRRPFSLFAVRPWALVAIALAVALISGYLVYDNIRLQQQIGAARAEQARLLQHQQEFEQELKQQQSANAETQKQLEQARTSAPNLRQLKTVAMLLWPPTRGATRIPALSLPEGTDLAVLTLAIESDEFSAYRAALKDPEANHVIWQSEDLESVPAGERRAISISFPASLLKAQNYIVELTVAPAKGHAKMVGAYPFRVVLK